MQTLVLVAHINSPRTHELHVVGNRLNRPNQVVVIVATTNPLLSPDDRAYFSANNLHVRQILVSRIRFEIVRLQRVDDLLIAQHATVRLLGGLNLPNQQLGQPSIASGRCCGHRPAGRQRLIFANNRALIVTCFCTTNKPWALRYQRAGSESSWPFSCGSLRQTGSFLRVLRHSDPNRSPVIRGLFIQLFLD